MNRIISPFDRHVWFHSSEVSEWKELIARDSIASNKDLQHFIEAYTPWYTDVHSLKASPFATNLLIHKVNQSEKFSTFPKEELQSRDSISKILHQNPDLFEEISLPSEIPPEDVHRMQKTPYWCGDFYTSDLVLKCLHESQISLKKNASYLDLGCSSGSLLRVLNWYYPDAHWIGCDPISKSIEWASDHLANIRFDCSDQIPPLPYEDNSLDGIISISVWSHHSELASRKWFDEAIRVLKPKGWFLFTTHGLRSLYRYVCQVDKGEERWRSVFEGFLQSNTIFEQVWLTEDDTGNDASDWGNLYVKPEWIYSELLRSFDLKLFRQGANQDNQDVYIVTKK